MEVLITGSNGLLGQNLIQHFNAGENNIYGCDLHQQTYLKSVKHNYLQLDITDRPKCISLIKEIKPKVIIHTAAMTAVDKCETEHEKCWQTNVLATDNLIQGASRVGAKIIFISTDYVFDGENGPYSEEDKPNPISFYGKSKLASEQLLSTSGIEWVALRTIVLYGVGNNVNASFVTWLLNMLRTQKSVRIVNDQWGNTTYVEDLCRAIERVIQLEKTGLFHVGGRGFQSRFNFAKSIANYFKLNEDLIHPITTADLKQPAPRPLKSGLEIGNTERELLLSFSTVEEALAKYKKAEMILAM